MVNPRFPVPPPGAVDAIESIHNPAVDQWMVGLFKLCRKLEKDC